MNDEKKPNKEDEAAAAAEKSNQLNIVILPPEAIREAAAKGTGLQLTISTAHSGPLPSPATLRAYDAVVPGLSATIIDEFKKETRHRRRIQTIGQSGAIAIAIISIIAGGALGYLLHSALAALAIVGPVCGVVGTAQLLEFWFKGK